MLFHEQGDPYGTVVALRDLGLMALAGNHHASATALFRESLEFWQRVGPKEGLIDWLARVATLAAATQAVRRGHIELDYPGTPESRDAGVALR